MLRFDSLDDSRPIRARSNNCVLWSYGVSMLLLNISTFLMILLALSALSQLYYQYGHIIIQTLQTIPDLLQQAQNTITRINADLTRVEALLNDFIAPRSTYNNLLTLMNNSQTTLNRVNNDLTLFESLTTLFEKVKSNITGH